MPQQIELNWEEIKQADDDNIGYCVNCKAEQDCCEPDARHYTCESCGQSQVFGIQELLLNDMVKILPSPRVHNDEFADIHED